MYSQPKFTIKTNISLIEVVSNQRFLPVSVDKSSRKLSRAIFLIMKGAKKRNLPFPTWKEDLWMGFQCKQGATIALEREEQKVGGTHFRFGQNIARDFSNPQISFLI